MVSISLHIWSNCTTVVLLSQSFIIT